MSKYIDRQGGKVKGRPAPGMTRFDIAPPGTSCLVSFFILPSAFQLLPRKNQTCALLCCNPNFPELLFHIFRFKCNFTIVKPKRKQALLGSNLLAISFMDELHPGRASNALLFYRDAGIPQWLGKPKPNYMTNKIPIKTTFYQQTQQKIGLHCPASIFIDSGLQP